MTFFTVTDDNEILSNNNRQIIPVMLNTARLKVLATSYGSG